MTPLRITLAILLTACAARAPALGTSASRLTSSPTGGCLSPLAYGAVVNDGIDDRAAVQAAIVDACAQRRRVCLPDGDLHVARRFGTGAANAWSLELTCDGVTIEGEGDVSRLVMLGSAQVGAMTGPGDWWVIKLSGSNHTLRGFTIDGATRTLPTSEQTHLVKLLGPARGMTIENVRLNLPDLGGSGTGGDCIQAGGEYFEVMGVPIDLRVVGVVIDKVRADECDRSFVGLQRWVSQVSIVNSRSIKVGDQVLDEEPTGIGTIDNVTIRDSHFRRNGLGDGVAVAIVGSVGGARAGLERTIESSTIDGSILISDTAHVTLRDVRVVSSGIAPTINVRKRTSDLLLDHVYAEHTGPTSAAVVFLGLQTSTWPTNVTVRASHLVQRSEGDVIRGEPVVGLTVEGNAIECLGPTSGLFSAVAVRSVSAVVSDVKVRSNTVSGNCRQLLRASATASFGVGATTSTDNTLRGGVTGVWFENGTPLVRPVVSGNTFDGVLSAAHVVGAGTAGFVGSN